MESVISAFNWIAAHYAEICAAVVSVLSGLIAIFAMIPGEQPEKSLQAVVDFIAKFSRKASKPE